MKSLRHHIKTNLLFTLLGLALVASSCDHKIQTSRKRADFLPNHAAIIIKSNNLERAKANLKKLSFINTNEKASFVQFFKKNILLNYLKTSYKEVSIGLSPTANGNYESTFITKDSIFKKHITKTPLEKFKGLPIFELNIENATFWLSQFEETYILCSNKNFLKSSIDQYKSHIDFKDITLIKTWDTEAIASFYINLEKTIAPVSFLDGFSKKLNTKGQLAGDFVLDHNNILVNVVYAFNSALNSFDFKTKRTLKLAEFFPFSNRNYSITTHHDLEETSESLETIENELLGNILTYSVIENNGQNVLSLDVLDSFNTKNLFDSSTGTDSTTIRKLKSTLDLKALNVPFDTNFDSLNFAFRVKNTLLFGDQNALETLKLQNNLSKESLTYQEVLKNLNQQSAYISVKTTEDFFKGLSLDDSLDLQEYPIAGISLQQNKDFGYVQLSIPQKIKQKKIAKRVEKVFEKPVSSPIVNGPFLFKNHLTKDNEIVLQTENYKLQRFSSEGKLIWSKALNEPIIGRIHEIDINNNGRLQMAFVTPSKWYILDKNGRDVEVFPKNFKSEITQPLSIFDYDSNHKYRFGITQGDSFLVYNKKGVKVGFHFKNQEKAEILSSPKHIRIGNKDFIVVNEEKNGVHFLSRTGKERVQLNKPIYTKHPWFFYKNTFSTLDKDQFLTQVSTNGKVGKLKKHPSDQFTKIDATAKTWVSFTGNQLYIKNNKVSLEFGSYTTPKIFYLRDKIYVSISNQENDTTYLFDSNAKPIKDFPIKGTGPMDMQLAKSKKFIDIVVKDTNNALLFYKLRTP